MPRRVKKLPLTAARNVRIRNSARCSIGYAVSGRVKSVACQQRARETRQKPQNFASVQRMLAKHLQHVRQQRDAGSEQNQPGHIERIRVLSR